MREMKDSGIEWIGKIPSDWTFTKLGRICEIITDGTHQTPEYIENGFPFISIKDISSGKLDFSECKYISESQHKELYAHAPVKKGDILFTRIGTLGIFVEVDTDVIFDFFVSVGMLRIIKGTVDQHYLIHYLNSPAVSNFIQSIRAGFGTAAPKYNLTDVKQTWVLLPSSDKQKEIAYFLDKKVSQIDELTSDIQSQIEALEEYKKSLVFRVVSKGLKKESLKTTTSDVWTSIPENWRLVDIKYVFEIVKRIAGQEGFDVLSVTQRGLKVKDVESNNGQQAESYAGYQFVYPTDYVMNHMDLLTGWVDCSTMFGVTSPDYRVFRLRDKENNDLTYFKYLMQCCYMSRIFYSLGQGVSNLGRWRLQTSAFNNFMIPVPPLEEQREIADYLDTKISEIDIIIADKQKQIETIEEYKKSLIFEYVTGKKEVQA